MWGRRPGTSKMGIEKRFSTANSIVATEEYCGMATYLLRGRNIAARTNIQSVWFSLLQPELLAIPSQGSLTWSRSVRCHGTYYIRAKSYSKMFPACLWFFFSPLRLCVGKKRWAVLSVHVSYGVITVHALVSQCWCSVYGAMWHLRKVMDNCVITFMFVHMNRTSYTFWGGWLYVLACIAGISTCAWIICFVCAFWKHNCLMFV